MELQKITEGVWCLFGAINISLIECEKGLIVIDTGLDSSDAQKIIRAADEIKRPITGIINTHAHADHFGGNAFLVAKTGANVYAPPFEKDVIEYPFWEPVYLFAGADPAEELRDKFFEAEACKVNYVLEPGDYDIEGIKIEVLPLPGHTFKQIGLVYREILFSADSIFQKDVLEKHQLPFGLDVEAWIDTLKMLAETKYDKCILGHGGLKESYQKAAERNKKWLECLSCEIYDLIAIEADDASGILERLCIRRGISFNKPGGFYLLQTSLNAYLTYLQKKRLIYAHVSKGRMFWTAKTAF